MTIAKDTNLGWLVRCNELLDSVQKGLAAYLEKKRLFFPRFFFLSNDEMLEILSETKDPTRVQPHMKKCFEGVDKLVFEGPKMEITGMSSVEKETVPFKNKVEPAKANGSVEKWLVEVEAAMFESVHDVTARGIEAYSQTPRIDWIVQWPGMVVLVVTAIFWTKGVTQAITDGKVAEYAKHLTDDLLAVVGKVRGELTKLERQTLGALVVMDVHARDVVDNMSKSNVTSPEDFDWAAQLRTYWEPRPDAEPGTPEAEEKTAMLRMMSAEVEYGYEYLGNSSRLVITPLTDRAYRTLIGAIHMTLGGAPEGPAGTGKTGPPRISPGPWPGSASCSTARTRWTTSPWASSSRAWPRLERGLALMSSTESTWRCSLWSPSRSLTCRGPLAQRSRPSCSREPSSGSSARLGAPSP